MKTLPTVARPSLNENDSQPSKPLTMPPVSGRMEAQTAESRAERKRMNQVHKSHNQRHAKRVPLDDAGRHTTVNAIMDGLRGFGPEDGARVATSMYDVDFFEAEPDSEFASMLCTELLAAFGNSPSANVTLWKKHQS